MSTNSSLLEACALMDVRQINRADARLGKSIHRDTRPKPIKTHTRRAAPQYGYIYKDVLYADCAHKIRIKSLKAPAAPASVSAPKLDIDGYKPLHIPAFARAPKFYPGARRKLKTMTATA